MSAPTSPLRPWPDCPLAVAYGLGVDSTAMLVEFARRAIRPDLILFADTGGEKPETYAYLPVIQDYLARVGFPAVVTVRYTPTRAAYDTLEAQCLHTGTLPSLAYGGKS
jgi:3'-phosphoadenosine 5'-phosphosulfate sulfotransferase (PAPS reductase)/FAD synthetase